MSWHREAKCAGDDPELFDVTGRTTEVPRLVYAMCNKCLVRRECATDALEPLAVGTIRAGVAIPDAWRKTAGAREALHRVERGGHA